MINAITVINYLGRMLTLELAAPEKSGLWVKSVTGIGSGKAAINVTNMASNDGSLFNSARAETRNIVLTLGMYDINIEDSEWSIEKARLLTYDYFPKKRAVTLIFHTDIRDLYIDGYVESNEPDIFNKEETAAISIICPDPNFYEANGGHDVNLAQIVDNFEFPYSNESLSENLTEFGLIQIGVSKASVPYYGDIETGMHFRIRFFGHVEGLRLYNLQTGAKIVIDDSKLDSEEFPNGIIAGDIIDIHTVRGNKSATITREGATYNIMNSLGMDPVWFQLYPGSNLFGFHADVGLEFIDISISFEEAYEGV